MSEIVTEEKRRDNRRLIIVSTIAGVVVLLLVGIIVALLLSKEEQQEVVQQVENKRPVLMTEDNADSFFGDAFEDEKVEVGSYVATMSTTWTFEDGKSPSLDAYVENAKFNTNAVYFDVMCSDDDEVVYESPVIPIGASLEGIKLDKELEKGTYDCVLTYHLVDDNQNTISTLKMALTIVIEK